MQISELIKDKTPVEIMHMINEMLGVMSAKGALVYDNDDNEWYLHHLEYKEDIDEIFFFCE